MLREAEGGVKYRKLRIAWSVGWGVLCLLLIALWVRSHYFDDVLFVELSNTQCIALDSMRGSLAIAILSRSEMPPNRNWWLGHSDIEPWYRFAPESTILPVWSLLLLLTMLAPLPWIRWRFSLRTLLIGVTVAAVLLGVIVALTG
jgi:hypothetical protein